MDNMYIVIKDQVIDPYCDGMLDKEALAILLAELCKRAGMSSEDIIDVVKYVI